VIKTGEEPGGRPPARAAPLRARGAFQKLVRGGGGAIFFYAPRHTLASALLRVLAGRKEEKARGELGRGVGGLEPWREASRGMDRDWRRAERRMPTMNSLSAPRDS
jgi:hypothetical protein